MDEILDKIVALIKQLTDFEMVTIGEPDNGIPNSVVNFATVEDIGETYEYTGNIMERKFLVEIKVGNVTAAPWVETAIKQSIDLSDQVVAKIRSHPNLGGLVGNQSFLREIESSIVLIGSEGQQRYARGRIQQWEFTKRESNIP